MQASPSKSFKLQKITQSPSVLSEPNSNERYIQPRINNPQISAFASTDNREIDTCSAYSSLIHKSLFSSQSSSLFTTLRGEKYEFSNKISTKPYKILDAPNLQDNFYYSILDWSSSNHISVALSTQLYLFNVSSGKVSNLFSNSYNITSLKFTKDSQLLSMGLENGEIHIFDTVTQKVIRKINDHNERVGVLQWKNCVLTSGSKDSHIIHSDIRAANCCFNIKAHSEEICGLQWNNDTLATGSNDNTLKIWENFSSFPVFTFKSHISAVKSLAWSPFENKTLLSGGGANDRTIKVWNVSTGEKISEVNTGSQVCNLIFSQNSNEFVSSHGYLKNEIVVWKFPEMLKQAELKGHEERVIYMAMSPSGDEIVTGAADKTLRFWKVFQKKQEKHTQVGIFEYMR